jgi:3-deoxy-D-manno-octulosonate 8-phosphate phosphatase (KDO 8-P phosphatase)
MTQSDNEQHRPSGERYPSDCEVTQGLRERAMARQPPPERGYVWRSCLVKARPVRLLLLDVDGVLTDGTITYTPEGTEIKTFHTKDGMGIRLLREAGVETGLVSARASEAVARRARDLSLKYVYQKVADKQALFERLCTELALQPAEVAFMGDDWLDLALLARVGFSATVADGAFEVRQRVDYVTKNPGGRGAVREVCDLILEAKGVHESFLGRYLRPCSK